MIGSMIAKAREEKGLTKLELANLTGINIGHLTHIEKGERKPSHKALKQICMVLDIPFQPLMYTYDRSLPKKHLEYDPTKYISCQKIPVFNSVTSFADCPSTHPSASFSLLMDDPTMDKSFDINTYVFVERNTSLAPGEIGLFFFNGKILIRKFSLQRTTPVLKTDYEELGKIFVREHDEFYIIGKIVR